MRELSSTTGPDGYGQTYGEIGYSSETSPGEVYRENLIEQANTVPLTAIFEFYGIKVNAYSNTIVCPFKSHKGGRENTGSFKYYTDTNSFYCYGCKTGGPWAHACEFVAFMDGIDKVKAAKKIIKNFSDKLNTISNVYTQEITTEQLEIMLDFSTTVREFMQTHSDEKSLIFIEDKCQIYDGLNAKRKNTTDGLRRIVQELKKRIKDYKP